jgi:GNAT superfamily N-acetyltransferase
LLRLNFQSDAQMNIRMLTTHDIPFIERLESELEWGLTAVPLEQMLDSAEGAFLLEDDGPVGVVFTFLYPPATGFIGKVIVRKDRRGMGYGTALVTHAIDFLHSRGAEEIMLDSVSNATGFYGRLGFEEVQKVWKLKVGIRDLQNALEHVSHVQVAETSLSEELVEMDRSLTGLDRLRVLKAMSNHADARLLQYNDGGVKAYLIVRRLEGMLIVGPMVGRSEGMTQLLAVAVEASGSVDGEVYLSTPDLSRDALDLLGSLGFRPFRWNLRMRLGGPRDEHARFSAIYAIASPAKG